MKVSNLCLPNGLNLRCDQQQIQKSHFIGCQRNLGFHVIFSFINCLDSCFTCLFDSAALVLRKRIRDTKIKRKTKIIILQWKKEEICKQEDSFHGKKFKKKKKMFISFITQQGGLDWLNTSNYGATKIIRTQWHKLVAIFLLPRYLSRQYGRRV